MRGELIKQLKLMINKELFLLMLQWFYLFFKKNPTI
jgi:hypothetical protein